LRTEREHVPGHQELLDRRQLALRVDRGRHARRLVEENRGLGRVGLRQREREQEHERRQADDDCRDQDA
jgi:hypothetical protein